MKTKLTWKSNFPCIYKYSCSWVTDITHFITFTKIFFSRCHIIRKSFSQYIIENFCVNYTKVSNNKSIEILQANGYEIIFLKFDRKNDSLICKQNYQSICLGKGYVFGQVF